MPCNPSVGGIAKSHLVVELDALGGEMGRNADFTALQYRMLNTRRGPAVQATRLQCDKPAYARRMQGIMTSTPNLTILEDEVIALRLRDGRAEGVWTAHNGEIEAKAVVLTAGTFLRGTIHIGHETVSGGGNGQPAANALADQLRGAGLSVARLKTGTPPRLDPASLHYDRMTRQDGDEPPPMFSWTARRVAHEEGAEVAERGESHAEGAEAAARHKPHAEFAKYAEFPARHEPRVESSESAEASAQHPMFHVEHAESTPSEGRQRENPETRRNTEAQITASHCLRPNAENASMVSSAREVRLCPTNTRKADSLPPGFAETLYSHAECAEAAARGESHAESAEVAARGESHAESAEVAARGESHAEGAEAAAQGESHAEGAKFAEFPVQLGSRADSSESANASVPSMRGSCAEASAGNPCYPCRPCETIAPTTGAEASAYHPMFHVEHRHPWLCNRRPCYLSHTTEETHRIASEHLRDSSLYGGDIVGTGARYCPSFEDKVVKFASRTSHHVFVEPESDDPSLDLAYPNGLSCSLPREIQVALVHSVPGLEDAVFRAWAYAIEYDFYDPRDLRPTLESRRIPGAFFAGQVNGTTGYEEAAAQGFMAGVNAAALVLGREPLVFDRAQAYIGVLIDDLVTKGTDEPYRMFTSRAERRLLLRQDNARYRLLDAAERLGIAPRAQLDETRAFASLIDAERERIFTERWQGRTLDVHLCREGVEYADLPGANPNLPAEVIEQVVLAARYRGYLEREETLARKMREQERVRIPDWIDYSAISVMRYESREKLQRVRPANLGQAARIPGVNPADIALLSVVIHRGPPA